MSIWTKLLETVTRAVRGPNADGRIDLYRDLAEALDKREDLLAFLQAEIRNCAIDKNAARSWVLRTMLTRRVVRASTDAGDGASFSRLLAGLIPEADRMQIEAIDAKPDVREQAEGFRRLAAMTELRKGMLKGVVEKMATPIVLIPLTYITALPTSQMITEITKDQDPSTITGIKLAGLVIGTFVVNWGMVTLVLLVAALVVLFYLLPNGTGQWRLRFDSLPVLGLYREWAGADVAMALASLLQSKVDLNDALSLVAARSTPWARWQITRVLNVLAAERSDDYVSAFSRGLFSPAMVARIATANRTANGIGAALIEVGTKGIDRVIERMNRTVGVIAGAVVALTTATVMTLTFAQLAVTSDLDATTQHSTQK